MKNQDLTGLREALAGLADATLVVRPDYSYDEERTEAAKAEPRHLASLSDEALHEELAA